MHPADQFDRIAFDVQYAAGAAKAGVVVTTSRGFGNPPVYVMWAIGTDGKITSHQLDALSTSEERLAAHVQGFIDNHRHAFAAA